MHYIGMDCHISTLEFAVVNEAGQLVKASHVATSVNGFVEIDIGLVGSKGNPSWFQNRRRW